MLLFTLASHLAVFCNIVSLFARLHVLKLKVSHKYKGSFDLSDRVYLPCLSIKQREARPMQVNQSKAMDWKQIQYELKEAKMLCIHVSAIFFFYQIITVCD